MIKTRVLIKKPIPIVMRANPIGECIEEYCQRAMDTNEPIENSSPIVFTKREDGVLPDYDIRTDRFERAATTMTELADAHQKSRISKIKARAEERAKTE